MSGFEACVKLAAYLFCIGLALELSHKLYWRINSWVMSLDLSTFSRAGLSSIAACLPLATALLVTASFAFLLDNASVQSLGLRYDDGSMNYVGTGAAVALGCVTLMFLVGLVSGFVEVKRSKVSDDCVSCMPMFLGGFADFFTAAVFEEVITRGYIYFVLQQAWGDVAAVVGSSVIFSVAHGVRHPSTPIIFMVNAFLFGLIAAMCRFYTDALWLPIGLHFGWNVAAGPIFGMPYMGREYDWGVIESEFTGPAWLTGGKYSPDAGILGTAALIIAAAGILAVTPTM